MLHKYAFFNLNINLGKFRERKLYDLRISPLYISLCWYALQCKHSICKYCC